MATLLVLGSKPDPALPPAGSFDSLACANASGRSAAHLGLPDPVLTVMSTVLTSGHKPANDLALQALRGLSTEVLYLLPRPQTRAGLPKRLLRWLKRYNVKPWYFKRRLAAIGYRYDKVCAHPLVRYHDIIRRLCGDDPDVAAQIERKQPSTGVMALGLGLEDSRFDRFILSGFSFEITHAYAHNPLIDQIGTTRSKHTESDIAVLRALWRCHGNICTTEPIVHERVGIPLFDLSFEPREGQLAG